MPLRIRMRVTVPETLLRVEAVRKEIGDVLKGETATDLKALFRKTTFGWSNKPTWRWHFTDRAQYMSETVWPDGPNADQYALVNNGSPPHNIFPINPRGYLMFRPGYRASTVPRVIGSRRNYRSGAYIFRKAIIPHPGFEAREFDATIADTYAPTFKRNIQGAIHRAVLSAKAETAMAYARDIARWAGSFG